MTYQTVNPFNNQLIKTYPDATDEDLENALARGHDLYKTWRKQEGPGDRPAQLRQVAKLFRQDEDALAANLTRDMGKLVGEARAEVELCADIADYFADHAEELLAPVPWTTALARPTTSSRQRASWSWWSPGTSPTTRSCVCLPPTSFWATP